MVVKVGNRTFKNFTQEQVDYIRKNAHKKFTDLEKETGVPTRRIGEIIKELGIDRKRNLKIYLPRTDEVEEDLRNPYLSHVELSKKYSVTESCIAKRRKELGITTRKMIGMTSLEKEIANILDDLDLAYHTNKRFQYGNKRGQNWEVDFYLGCKTILEVHGQYYHSSDKKRDQDERKRDYFLTKGYSYLVITESEINEDIETVRDKIQDITHGFPR